MNYDDVIHHHSNEHHNSHSFAMISSLSHRDGLTNVLLNYHRKWIFILWQKNGRKRKRDLFSKLAINSGKIKWNWTLCNLSEYLRYLNTRKIEWFQVLFRTHAWCVIIFMRFFSLHLRIKERKVHFDVKLLFSLLICIFLLVAVLTFLMNVFLLFPLFV